MDNKTIINNINRDQAKELISMLQEYIGAEDLIPTYKIKIINKKTNRQMSKKVYESYEKFMRYGKDIYTRKHNHRYLNGFESQCKIFQMSAAGEWVEIPAPDDFITKV